MGVLQESDSSPTESDSSPTESEKESDRILIGVQQNSILLLSLAMILLNYHVKS